MVDKSLGGDLVMSGELYRRAETAKFLAARGRVDEAGATLAPYAELLASPDLPEFLRPLAAHFAVAAAA